MIECFFFDTCIFVIKALDVQTDKRCAKCHIIINATIPKYTSITVKREIEKKKNDLESVHEEILDHLAAGKSLNNFVPKTTNPNDRKYAYDLVARLIVYIPEAEMPKYLREYQARIEDSLDESLSLLASSPVVPVRELLIEGWLKKNGIHGEDALIVAEYFSWGRNMQPSAFITGDGGPALTDRVRIISGVAAQLAAAIEKFSILSIGETTRIVANMSPRKAMLKPKNADPDFY